MSDPNKDIIRISHEEATSGHVEDLIKRQMSLRGESGVTRDRGRVWFYQSWFLLLIVGGVAAFTAWALIEPYFSDSIYWQGEIQKIDRGDSVLEAIVSNKRSRNVAREEFGEPAGSVTIRGQKIYLTHGTRNLVKGHGKGYLDVDDIQVGQEIGVYLERTS